MDDMSRAAYQRDLERYERERTSALAAGYARSHPLVKMWTRRIGVVNKLLERLAAEDAPEESQAHD